MKKVFILLLLIGCNQPGQSKDYTLSEILLIDKKMLTEFAQKNDSGMVSAVFNSLEKDIKKYPTDTSVVQAKQLLAKRDSFRLLFKKQKEANIELAQTTKELTREGYQFQLRNFFLDKNMDIKVEISGKNSEQMKLTYILFTDVWFRKFETEKLFDQWFSMGFKSVTLDNGHDYIRKIFVK